MELKRTANAGVLLKLDGVSILLDGVCGEVFPYPATPPEERALLTASWPDVVAFTHAHQDHYDPAYAAAYQKQTGGVVLGPEELPGVQSSMEPVTVGKVKVTPVSSRHLGAAGKDTPHASFILEGSRCVWFVGDAAPSQWKTRPDLPKPDVLIAPYVYANTPGVWLFSKALAERIVVLHMPQRQMDSFGLWEAVESTAKSDPVLQIPDMGEVLTL